MSIYNTKNKLFSKLSEIYEETLVNQKKRINMGHLKNKFQPIILNKHSLARIYQIRNTYTKIEMHSAFTNICHLGWRGGENKLVKEGTNIKDDDEQHHSKHNRKKVNKKETNILFFFLTPNRHPITTPSHHLSLDTDAKETTTLC